MKAIVLAGGKGSRMKRINNTPKVFQPVHDTPMIEITIHKLIQSGFKEEDIILVLSPETYLYALEHLVFTKTQIVIQHEANGSGGAVKVCMDKFTDDERVLIISGDGPLFNVSSIKKMIKNNKSCLSVTNTNNPLGFGRIILRNGVVTNIVEESDCTKKESEIKIVNTSIYYTKGKELKIALDKLDTNNSQKEYYLTDIVKTYPLCPHYLGEVEGYNINTPEHLKEANVFYLNAPNPPYSHVSITKGDKRIIVVSDIHGCFKTFMKLLDTVNYNKETDILISVGDIIMKGPDSKAVVQWFLSNRKNVYCVRGNHEEKQLGISSMMGESSVLTSKELSYLALLPYTITVDDINLIIVHAGLVEGVELSDQSVYNLTQMRNAYSDKFDNLCGSHMRDIGKHWCKFWNGSFVIYGHDAKRGLSKNKNTYGIDTGCCYGNKLTACIISDTSQCDHNTIQTISVNNCE